MPEINFNPWTNNVLDYVNVPLVTANDEPVIIKQDMTGTFFVIVNAVIVEKNLSNIAASSVLNRIGVSQHIYRDDSDESDIPGGFDFADDVNYMSDY